VSTDLAALRERLSAPGDGEARDLVDLAAWVAADQAACLSRHERLAHEMLAARVDLVRARGLGDADRMAEAARELVDLAGDLTRLSRNPDVPGADREPKETRPLRALSAAEVMTEPRPVPIIEGVAWAGRITVMVSESGAGKTFELLRAGADVADGSTHHGRRVRRGPVVYASYEGDALGLRLTALREAGYSLDGLHVIRASEPLSPRVERDGTEHPSFGELALAEELARLRAHLQATGRAPIVLLIFDTIRASLAGSEDSSEDVSAYLRAARRILAPYPEAGCILAHHSGWQDGEQRRKRERGSSAFRGNADATLYLEVTGEDAEEHLAYLTLRALKVRDEERPAPLRLVRRRVTVTEMDENGESRTTCIVERDHRSAESIEEAAAQAEAERQADLERRALDVVRKGKVTSIATLRALLGCAQPVASELLAKLQATGRIARKSQREPYRAVPSRTHSTASTTESYRTARPIGGTGTTRREGTSRTGSGGQS